MSSKKKAAAKPTEKFNPPSSDDIRQLSLAMVELSTSLHEFVEYMTNNPEIAQIPDSIRELTKRISVLSTRL